MCRSILNISRFLFIVLSFLILSESFGQNLANSRQSSYYMYIYKLKTEDVKDVLKSTYRIDAEKYLTNLVDSFPMDSVGKTEPVLENGQYLFASVIKHKVEVEYKQVTDLDINVIKNSRDLIISTFDKTSGEVIHDADVTLGKKKVPYEPSMQAFILYKYKKEGLLVIETKNDTAFYNIEIYNYRDKYRYKWRKLRWKIRYAFNFSEKKKYKLKADSKLGYIAFSKPKYLPNDTLRLKALIVSKKGKPYKKLVTLKIRAKWDEDIIIKNRFLQLVMVFIFIVCL